MLRYIIKRIFIAFLTLLVIATLTFFLMKLIPGSPFTNPKIKLEIRMALERQYGLDRPILEQYVMYLKNVLKGDFGTSMKYPGRSVTQMILDKFPHSFALGWRATVFAVSLGLLFGVIAALNHEGILDYLTMFIAIVGVAVPSIVLGPLLAYILGVNLGWFPVAVDGTEWSMVLPSVTLGLGSLATISRLMRTTTLEVLNQDYIQTAKAKGLTKPQIVFKHVIRNAIMPVITVLGPLFAALITGSIVIEGIFAVPGLGKYFVSSIYEQDYPMVMGITLFYAVLIIFSILLVDLAYGFIDPRLRVSSKGGK